MLHEEKARQLFRMGYNCSQSVFAAFCDVTGMDEKTALALSSSFGGGLGRLREVCGAVSGMAMTAGLLWGYSDAADSEAKKEHYALIQALVKEFSAKNGSFVCRELLGTSTEKPSPEPTPRTESFYHKRPCEEYVADCVRQLDAMLTK